MKIKIDVSKSIYEQTWWPNLKPDQKLKVLEVYKSTEWLHKAINDARKKEFPFLFNKDGTQKTPTQQRSKDGDQ